MWGRRTAVVAALAVYAVAMAYVEAAVVIYLRRLYPAVASAMALPFAPLVYRTEVLREAATIVMLLAVGYLAVQRWAAKALAFLFAFAVWDLFYYVFLKVTLGWPHSLADIDVLFLIPVPWIAPVWVPVLLSSATLLVAGYLLLTGIAEEV